MKTRVITAIFITVALVAILLLSNTVVYSIALSVFAVIAANEVLKAYDLDKKIRNLIDDLKIEIVKAKEGDKAQAKMDGIIRELKLKIAERKALN